MKKPSPSDSSSSSAFSEAGLPSLTDFLDLDTLQAIQDSFAVMAGLGTQIVDAEGQPLTRPTDPDREASTERTVQWLTQPEAEESSASFTAPIEVSDQAIGSIVVEAGDVRSLDTAARQRLTELLTGAGLAPEQVEELVEQIGHAVAPSRAAAVQLLYLLASAITRLCGREYEVRRRVDELSTLYNLSTLLAGYRDLQQILDHAAQSAAEVMDVKAASIRLLDDDGKEATPRAVFNLSQDYLEKGPLVVERSEIYRAALEGEVVYVEDMRTDPRALYPEDAEEEGLVSMLFAGIIYKDKPIGVIQLGTEEKRSFGPYQKRLLKAVAQLVATAIENARLNAVRRESERVQRQLHLAADVQRRMLPSEVPSVPGFEIAARYVPSFELSGDFYDFLPLGDHIGIVVGDVVGKGVAASLLMSSVRASLRAYAQDLYDIDAILQRVNEAMSRDTLPNEFATLFYGVIDPATLRMTYCNAGHDPPLLMRNGEVIELDTGGMIVGVDAGQSYEKGVLDLEVGDAILMYTDGLIDAMNFEDEKFGRDRMREAFSESVDRPAQQMVNHVLWQMRRFAGLKRLVDDTTLVGLKVVEQVG
ncbi:MAG: SpoIIE family protein phosphatase [Phycisphaeraceae bacterium]|nr:SpoIIE family protein phosphatase [Phycisphaeraceae bacterium]